MAVNISAPRIAKITRDQQVRMRDGVALASDIYFPADVEAPHPTILLRTPYGKSDHDEQAAPLAKFLTSKGFAVVTQDLRGTGNSEGLFKPYCNIEGNDGYDTLDWLGDQSWCNRKIGTIGCSYHGEVQDMLAVKRHPLHKAAFIEGAYTYNDGGMRAFSYVRHGAIELAYAVGGSHELLNTLPLSKIKDAWKKLKPGYYPRRWPDAVHAWLTTPPADSFWEDDGGIGDDFKVDVPAIHMNEWYSNPFSSIKMFELFQKNASSACARQNQFLVLSPMTHCGTAKACEDTIVGERDLGDARFDYFGLMVKWFRHWLCDGEGNFSSPKVQYYAMGANEWRLSEDWPLPTVTTERLFLSSKTSSNSIAGDGMLSCDGGAGAGRDSFLYDPKDPVPSLGGPVNSTGVLTAGGFDQQEIENRDDLLVYTTPKLLKPLTIAGCVKAVLYVSSNAPDTDFTAKLVDVYPDGRAFNVLEGIVRMRYREGVDTLQWMNEGDIYQIEIDLDSTCNVFRAGHKIRLEITSSNFPRYDRNLNTNDDIGFGDRCITAENTVYFGPQHGSCLLLPIVGGAEALNNAFLPPIDAEREMATV